MGFLGRHLHRVEIQAGEVVTAAALSVDFPRWYKQCYAVEEVLAARTSSLSLRTLGMVEVQVVVRNGTAFRYLFKGWSLFMEHRAVCSDRPTKPRRALELSAAGNCSGTNDSAGLASAGRAHRNESIIQLDANYVCGQRPFSRRSPDRHATLIGIGVQTLAVNTANAARGKRQSIMHCSYSPTPRAHLTPSVPFMSRCVVSATTGAKRHECDVQQDMCRLRSCDAVHHALSFTASYHWEPPPWHQRKVRVLKEVAATTLSTPATTTSSEEVELRWLDEAR